MVLSDATRALQDLHENWLSQLIVAQAETKNTTKAHLWKQLKQKRKLGFKCYH